MPADLTKMVESLQDFCSAASLREEPTVKLVLSPSQECDEITPPVIDALTRVDIACRYPEVGVCL
jgi:hypothetical protein